MSQYSLRPVPRPCTACRQGSANARITQTKQGSKTIRHTVWICANCGNTVAREAQEIPDAT